MQNVERLLRYIAAKAKAKKKGNFTSFHLVVRHQFGFGSVRMVMNRSVYNSTVGEAPAPLTSWKSGKSSSSLSEGLLITVVAVLLLVTLVIIFCCLFRRKIRNIIHRWRQTKKGIMEQDEEILLRRFQMEELMKATNNFSQDCLLGSGAFGNVYRGSFNAQGTDLAIKKPRADSYQTVEEFRNEVRLLSKVKHKNLIALVGYCEEPGSKGAKILVYEFVPNGSLLEYIMGRRREVLTWRQRVTLAIGAAKGIAHLHEGVKPSIIHRDIKPSNILIGQGFEAKVSDFGLVRSGPVEDQSHVSSQVKGTPGYLDPAYCTSLHLTPFSDVYSFGVILLQLVAARPAVDTTRNNSNYHIIEWARESLERGAVEEILDANLLTEPCNAKIMLKMGQLALRCVAKSPKHRPTMAQVAEELELALYEADICEKYTSSEELLVEGQDESFVSINGVGLQRFHVDMDSISFQSASLRCLDLESNSSVCLDTDISRGLEGIRRNF